MKTYNLIILGVVLFQCKLFAGGIIPVSRWKNHEIRIDGNDRDWDKPINFYDVKTGLFFAITNDSSTLYLNFTATDPEKMQNLMKGGWTLAFAAKNKKSKAKASLTFEASRGGGMSNRMGMDGKLNFGTNNVPDKKGGLSRPNSEMPDASAQPVVDNRAVMDYARSLRSFRAHGFIFTHDEISTQSTTGIQVRVGNSDPAGLLYEIAIPFNELFEEDSVRLDELISMTITVNASEQTEAGAGNRRQSGGPGSMPGGGGRPGGMAGGGPQGGQMPGGAMGGERPASENPAVGKVIFKQKFRLASH